MSTETNYRLLVILWAVVALLLLVVLNNRLSVNNRLMVENNQLVRYRIEVAEVHNKVTKEGLQKLQRHFNIPHDTTTTQKAALRFNAAGTNE